MAPLHPGPSVGIVMLSWGQPQLTRQCVESIQHNTSPELFKLFWVQNEAGKDRKAFEEIEGILYPERHTIFYNETNLGFAKGVNQALDHILKHEPDIQHVCLLNNDTEVPMHWLMKMVVALGEDYGALGSLTDNGGFQRYDHMHRQYPGQIQRPWDKETWLHYSRRLAMANKFYDNIETSELAFFCTVIPVHVIREIGLLDERFGLALGEDNDYCIRIRNAGYKIGVTPNVVVHHAHGGTFKMSGIDREQAHKTAQRILKEKWE